MKLRTAIVLVILVVVAAPMLYARHLSNNLHRAEARIAELEHLLAQHAATSPSLVTPSSRTSITREDPPSPAEPSPTPPSLIAEPRSVSPDAAAALQERAVAWRVQWQSTEIERNLALSDEERARLRAALEERFRHDLSSDQSEELAFDETTVVEEVLGKEVAERYRAARTEREHRRIAREIEEETALLSRRLALNGEGETTLKNALESAFQASEPIRAEIRSRMRSAMRSHSGAESDQATLQARYDEIRALMEQAREIRREALVTELRDRLTDEQLNEILSYQATRYE